MNDNKETEDKLKPKNFFTIFTVINIVLFVSLILYCVYVYYYKKDFKFIIETSCSIVEDECFVRDCTNEEDCPPNNLSMFKRYSINASDFKYCENEDCTLACQNNQITCNKVECSPNVEMGESCQGPIVFKEITE